MRHGFWDVGIEPSKVFDFKNLDVKFAELNQLQSAIDLYVPKSPIQEFMSEKKKIKIEVPKNKGVFKISGLAADTKVLNKNFTKKFN